jgi:hypothetical protein
MMRNAGFIVLAVILLQSCADLGSSPEPGIPSEPELVSSKFVVDLFAVECTVKVNPGNDSLWAYFPCTVKYHFEGLPGTLDKVDFVPIGFMSTSVFYDYLYPDSVGRSYVLSQGFWTNSSLAQLDSVVIQCALSGGYWNPATGQPSSLGPFAWTAERKIPVRHQ